MVDAPAFTSLDDILNTPAPGAPTPQAGPPSGAETAGAPGPASGGFITEQVPEGEYTRPALPGETPTTPAGTGGTTLAPPGAPPVPAPSGGNPEAPAPGPKSFTSLDDILAEPNAPASTTQAPSGPGAPPPAADSGAGASVGDFVTQYGEGVAYKLAERTGQAADLVTLRPVIDTAIKKVGEWVMDNPDKLNAVLDNARTPALLEGFLKKAGLPAPDKSTFGGELGGETVDSLIMLAALRGAAPYFTAMKGTNVGSRFLMKYGEALKRHPWLAATNDIFGATPGGVYGKRLTGSEYGAIPGAIIGGGLEMMGAKIARKVGLGVVGLFKKKPTNPLIPNANPEWPREFGGQQLEGDLLQVENSIAKAINGIRRPPQNATKLQTAVYEGLQKAEKVAEGVEHGYWSRVKVLKNGINPDDVIPQVKALFKAQKGVDAEAEIPIDVYKRVLKLFKDNGKTVSVPTIQRLRAEMRQVRREVQDEWGKVVRGKQPNEVRIKNLNQLQSILNAAIRAAAPGDVTLQQAANFSVEVGNLFSRGLIPKIITATRNGMPAVRPAQTMEELLAQNNGLEDVLKMSQRMRTNAAWRTVPGGRAGTANPPAIGAQGVADLKQLEKDMGNSLRAMFHETIDKARVNGELSPQAASSILKKMLPDVGPMARVAASMKQRVDRLATLIQEKATLDKSALARYIQADADKAISKVLSNPPNGDPAGYAKALMKTFAKDPSALAGFQNGLMKQMVDRNLTKGVLDPVAFKKYLADPTVRRMLAQVWKPEELARLDRMVSMSSKLATGEIKLFRARFLSPMMIAGGIFGSTIARKVLNTGTLQAPQYMAKVFRGTVVKMMSGIDTGTLLQLAMKDPVWEQALLKPEPKFYLKAMAKLVRRMEALRGSQQDRFERDAIGTPAPTSQGGSIKQQQTGGEGANPFGDYSRYPSPIERGISQGNDLSYGDRSAPFFKEGATLRETSVGSALTAFRNKEMPDGPHKPISQDTADALHQGWLAAQRSPLAALGYDPRTVVRSPPDDPRQLTLVGAYKKNNIWYDAKYPATIVHESMHRGFSMMRKEGLLVDNISGYAPQGKVWLPKSYEEYAIRALVQKHLGNVEVGLGEAGDKQIERAKQLITPRMMDQIEAAASKLYASQKGRGPK